VVRLLRPRPGAAAAPAKEEKKPGGKDKKK